MTTCTLHWASDTMWKAAPVTSTRLPFRLAIMTTSPFGILELVGGRTGCKGPAGGKASCNYLKTEYMLPSDAIPMC